MDNNVKNSSVYILDCTLRDGGYYNNWDFESDVVNRYLQAMEAASIDVVEIGFRSLPKPSLMGPFAFCTDDFLETFNLPEGSKIGVMVNCK